MFMLSSSWKSSLQAYGISTREIYHSLLSASPTLVLLLQFLQ